MKNKFFKKLVDKFNDIEQTSSLGVAGRAIIKCSEELATLVAKPSYTRGILLAIKFNEAFKNDDRYRHTLNAFATNWNSIYDDSITDLLFKVFYNPKLTSHVRRRETKTDTDHIKYVTYKDVTFGASFSQRNTAQSYIYYKNATYEQVREIIHNIFWLVYDTNCVNLSSRAVIDGYDKDRHFCIKTSVSNFNMTSEVGDYEILKIKNALDKNINRSILYYGNPGTGKSTVCNYITSKLKLKTVRIKFSDLALNDNIIHLIEALQPQAIIIDDIDRSNNDVLINFLENVKNYAQLILATANNKNEIDCACLRPGRFDDLVEINKLDENVIKNVLGPENIEFFDQVKLWPIAYINELVTRTKIMNTREEVVSSLKDLHERIKSIQSNSENTELENETFGSLI